MLDNDKRSSDKEGFRSYMCWTARRLSEFWDFVDKRDIDKHAVSLAIMYGTIVVLKWNMGFVEQHSDKTGLEIAAILAAVNVPYMALQAAAIQLYFKARQ